MFYRRLLHTVRDFFGFSQNETRGFLALILFVGIILALPWLYRLMLSDEPVATPVTSDQQLLDSLTARLETQSPETNRPEQAETGAPYSPKAAELFTFNPNTVSGADWQRLGLPRWLADRIVKYRSRGGQFRKKEDLLRIYDFPPELYDRLEPYIQLPQGAASGETYARSTQPSFPGKTAPPTNGEKNAFPERPAKPALQPFDINAADTTQLIRLKGIGSKLAVRIVKFRDALGGFASTAQYAEIFGLDSLAREELLKWGKIQSPVRRIPINTASAEELDRHPFLSRRQAEIIVRYREQHGAYQSITDLKPIRILDAATLEKLSPYLAFQ